MDSSSFPRNLERPAWLVLRLDGENAHRATLAELDDMRALHARACAQFPERCVELVRLWGRPIALSVTLDGQLAMTRALTQKKEIDAEFLRLKQRHAGADVRLIEMFGDRGLRAEVIERRDALPPST